MCPKFSKVRKTHLLVLSDVQTLVGREILSEGRCRASATHIIPFRPRVGRTDQTVWKEMGNGKGVLIHKKGSKP